MIKTTKAKTNIKTAHILACALALLVAPAAGFTQPGTEAPDPTRADDESLVPAPVPSLPRYDAERSRADEIELGDVGPAVTVVRLLVARDVSEREPVGTASEFAVSDTSHLFAFMEVSNERGETTDVTVAWVDSATGKTERSYDLTIGASKRWRTWARAAAPKQPGAWSIVLTDDSGNQLASTDFTMVQ
jgi:hypothetical protein